MNISQKNRIANVAKSLAAIDRAASSRPAHKKPSAKPAVTSASAARLARQAQIAARMRRTASEDIQTEIVNGIVDVASGHGLDITHEDVLKQLNLGKLISGWKSMDGFKR